MKSKVLRFANGILATLMALLGFSSCGKSTSIECIYGGPDMMDRTMPDPEETDSSDTLSLDSLKDAVNKGKQPKPVMYGGPYSRYNSKPKTIQK